MAILVFGDSIAYGGFDEEGGWVARLRKYFDTSTEEPRAVFNLGISGNTSVDLVDRFETETISRLDVNEEPLIIFEIGINDSQFLNDTGAFRVPLDTFRENLEILITTAQRYTSRIVLLGLTPVDESRVDPIPWAQEVSYKNEYIKEFDGVIQEIAEVQGVSFIEMFDVFGMDSAPLLFDGVHPNSEGHELIFETVRSYLLEHELV